MCGGGGRGAVWGGGRGAVWGREGGGAVCVLCPRAAITVCFRLVFRKPLFDKGS